MLPLLLPVGVFAFLGGIALGSRSKKPLSMLPPKKPIIWERFVTIMAVSPRAHVSPRRRLGAFQMDARQLGDIGWIEAPRKMVVGKELGVWSGKWKDGLSEEKFLASAPLQYEAFKKSVKRISPKVQKHVGTVVDGHKCSLSGLLGVAHHAGVIGVDSWVKDPDVRKRFKTTTETFKKTNGIF